MTTVQPVYGGQQIIQPIQQPIATQVVVQQPQGNTKMVCSREGHRTWSSDMFDCVDERTSCLFTCLCPCITLAEISKRMGENIVSGICIPGGVVAIRARLRTMGGIKGSICGDCLTLCFCCVCAVGQMERELYHMGI